MPEEIFAKNVNRLENIYSLLIKGGTTPQQESEMRVELIDVISNLEAALINSKDKNKDFINLLTKSRENILHWEPYGHWFRHQKKLVDLVYEVIVQTKKVVFSKEYQSSSEASRLKAELDGLKSELFELKSLMNALVKEKRTIIEATLQNNETQVMSIESQEKKDSDQVQASVEEDTEDKDDVNQVKSIMEQPEIIVEEEVIDSNISTSYEIEDDFDLGEEAVMIPTKTIEKLSSTKSQEHNPSIVLDQMKSLLSEAEEETEKQLLNIKETYKYQKQVEEETPDTKTTKTATQSKAIEDIKLLEKIEQSLATEGEDTNVKPSDLLDLKSDDHKEIIDPYMQLLTLEAEKYRLEKDLEKTEIAFQEGLKTKRDFDEIINKINKELTAIREQIISLRKELTS